MAKKKLSKPPRNPEAGPRANRKPEIRYRLQQRRGSKDVIVTVLNGPHAGITFKEERVVRPDKGGHLPKGPIEGTSQQLYVDLGKHHRKDSPERLKAARAKWLHKRKPKGKPTVEISPMGFHRPGIPANKEKRPRPDTPQRKSTTMFIRPKKKDE